MKKPLSRLFSILISFLLIFTSINLSFAWEADIDETFDTGEIIGFNNTINTITTQNDGKILLGGSFSSYKGVSASRIIRLNSSGSIDSSFDIGTGFNNTVNAIAAQNDGKILLGGSFSSYKGVSASRIIRLNSSGSIDSSFNIGTGFNSVVNAITIQNDDKILLGGSFSSYKGVSARYILRLNLDGSIDSSFDIGTGFNSSVNVIKAQNDGKILLGGSFSSYKGVSASRIVRLNSGGSIDSSFDIGTGFNNTVNTIAVQNDGKILLGGFFSSYKGVSANRIIRLNADGSIDSSFDIGSGFNDGIRSITIENENKIIIGGDFTSYNGTTANRIIKLNPDGSIDNSFDIGSGLDGYVTSAIIYEDKIILGGNFNKYKSITKNKIISLYLNGEINNDLLIGNGFDARINSIAIDNNKVFVVGYFTTYQGKKTNRIAKLLPDGSIDTSFNIGSGFDNEASFITINNNKIIVAGKFTSYNGITANRIIRLNIDGSIDSSFNIGSGFDNYISSIAIDNNNKIIAVGGFTSYNGITANRIIRLNTDGSIDSSFDTGSGFNQGLNIVKIDKEDNIIVGSNSPVSYKGSNPSYLFKIQPNGIINLNFKNYSFGGGGGQSIGIDNENRMIIGGSFFSYSGSSSNRIVRLLPNGEKDNSFNIGNGFNNTINQVVIDNNNKIIVGGFFTSYSGTIANRIIRLNTDGSIDSSFNLNSGFNDTVRGVSVNSQNKIIIGGDFTSYNNEPKAYLITLGAPVTIPNSTDENSIQSEFTNKGYSLSNNELIGSNKVSLSQTNGLIPASVILNNSGNKLTLPTNLQFKKPDNSNYNGTIIPPTPVSNPTIIGTTPISTIEVGSQTESLTLDRAATLKIPTPGKNIGDKLSIYSSQDGGNTWTKQSKTTVQLCDTNPCVSFNTTHFSQFSVGEDQYEFLINSGSTSTSSKDVTLNITANLGLIQKMRFSNSNNFDGIAWINYATSYPWTLIDENGSKTVYAEFDFDGNGSTDAATSETIYLNGSIEGQISLNILSGESSCIYGTSINLGAKDIPSNFGGLEFIGNFTGSLGTNAWSCTDYAGTTGGRDLTIQSADLKNSTNNIISGTNVMISYDNPVLAGGDCVIGNTGSVDQSIGTVYTMIAKGATSERRVCKIQINNVSMKIAVPANQAPGSYSGLLTITLPNFN